jgi:hypothetical protein
MGIRIDALNAALAATRDHRIPAMKDGVTVYLTAGQILDLIIGSAPGVVDTIEELAASLGNDPDAVGTLTALINARLVAANNLSDLVDAPTALTNLGLSTYFKTLVGETDAQSLLTTLGGGSQLLQVEDVTSPVSTVFFDLPAGYRTFRLSIARLIPSATASFRMTMSFDGGSTYVNTSGTYEWTHVYASRSATPTKYADNGTTTGAYIELLPGSVLGSGNANQCEIVINPSETSAYPSVMMQSHVQSTSSGAVTSSASATYLGGAFRPTNLALFFNGTTIANAHMRLYGDLG